MIKGTKLLTMAAAIAVLSAPAMAATTHKKNVDLDGDGQADVYMKALPKEGNLLKALDTDGNGRITQAEFQENTIHDNEAEVFAMYDTDQNGFITQTELKNNSKFGGQKIQSDTTSNLQTKSGKTVGSLDEKYYNKTATNESGAVDNPFHDDPELKNDKNINIDNPFRDDPELKNDTNWNWPKDFKFEPMVNANKPLFEQLDSNRNGKISQKEFMKNTIHNNEAEVFTSLDTNDDKNISRAELKTQTKTSAKMTK